MSEASEKIRTTWRHRDGDRYIHIMANAWMNESGYGIHHTARSWEFATAAQAWRDGLRTLNRSDDFNTGVLRGGKLVAILWNQEVVDADPDVVGAIANEVGIDA